MVNKEDEKYMRHCLELAEQALHSGNPPVGAILVLVDQIIGSGIEAARTSGDVTDHAEIIAIRDAVRNGYRDQLAGARMFTTHEPCIMCSYVIRHHKIAEIVYGVAVANVGGHSSGFALLSTEAIPQWGLAPVIRKGIFEKEASALTHTFTLSTNKDKK